MLQALASVLSEHCRVRDVSSSGRELFEVFPGDEGDVSAVLRVCAEQKLTVAPLGSGTKSDWGKRADADVLLGMRRLQGVREHVWQDMTATVAAGTRWGEMQAELAQHNQRVALDPIYPDRATVGGIVATNDSGSLRARYGSLRDLVLGATVVLADGTIARTGGKVVKNVAGYDLPKLMTGSFGTLAVITEITFRLHGVPREATTWTAHAQDIEALSKLMISVTRSELSVEAMQMRSSSEDVALDIQLAATSEILQSMEERLVTIATGFELEPGDTTVWGARERLFSAANAMPETMVVKITALPVQVTTIVAVLVELARGGTISTTCVANPVGIVTASIAGPAELLRGTVDDLRARLSSVGGTVVVLRPGVLGDTFDRWGSLPSAIAIMRDLKAEFDPAGTLSPGRFVGGI